MTVLTISGCSSTPSEPVAAYKDNSYPHVVNNVYITEPLRVDYKSEIAIAKLTQLINHANLEKEKLAQLLYDRGVIYDSLGLKSLAQLDFRRALEVQPAHADAYNFIGIHLTLLGKYEQAFDAFDSALEINPEHGYVHLNRGIALHYYGRYQLSIQDLETFHLKNTADPYRAVWLYLSEAEIDREGARLRLLYNSTMLDKSKWAFQIIQMLLGEMDHKTFIKQMGENLSNSRELVDRLCEGYFYLAKSSLLDGEVERAKNYFRLALTTNVYEFVEHKYSRLELQKLYIEAANAYKDSLLPEYAPDGDNEQPSNIN